MAPPGASAPAAGPSLGPDREAGDVYVVRPTPVGPACVALGPAGLVAVGIGEPSGFEAAFARRFGAPPRRVVELPAEVLAAVDRALAAGTPDGLPVDWRRTSPFQQAVLEKITEIPAGEVRPYAWVAAEIGLPRAARAVGTALAANPMPLVFPCHRVVRADGHLGNYGYGAAAKRALLAAEGADVDALDACARRGVRVLGSPGSRRFCYPSCAAPRAAVESGEIVAFAGSAAALAAGFRPCPRCRPVAP